MIGLDTNIVVRYLAQDDKTQSLAATRLINTELSTDARGYISLVVLAETVWVMTSLYDADRSTVARTIEGLLSAPQLALQESESIWLALLEYRESTADFSDALLSRLARAAGCGHTLTFDRAAAKHPGFALLK